MGEVLKGKLVSNNVALGAFIGGSLAQRAYSPTVELTETDKGVNIAMTDVNGRHEATVYNGNDYQLTDEDREEISEILKENLDFDNAPTDGSNNLVTSGVVYDAIENLESKVSIIEPGTGTGSIKSKDFEDFSQTASGDGSFAIGADTEASGDFSVAEGEGTTASGYSSHAEGSWNTASGNYSHAEGYSTQATKETSHAEGNSTKSTGTAAHAEGNTTTASGTASHAEGMNTKAIGSYSHAEGYGTIANGRYQHVQGTYNIEDLSGDYIHIVGSGTSDNNRANAYTLSTGGHAWYALGVSVGHKTPTDPGDLTSKQYVDAEIAKKQDPLVFDSEPNIMSSNPVTSSGIWNMKRDIDNDISFIDTRIDSLQSDVIGLTVTKQNTLRFDDLPTENSTNMVKSGGIYSAIANIKSMQIHICTSGEYNAQTGVPTISEPDPKTFYLVPSGDGNNLYIEWVYVDEAWEQFGSASIDLSDYATKTELNEKQDELIFDDLPTVGSDNPVKSSGIKAAIDTVISNIPSVTGKADKVANAAAGNLAGLDLNGNLTDSGVKASDFLTSAPVTDVQINGASVLNNGTANIPIASSSNFGAVKIAQANGIELSSANALVTVRASVEDTKASGDSYKVITPYNQNASVFYGLAKAAGDMTQSASSNAVGTYTSEAKAAIRAMIGAENGDDIIKVQNTQPTGSATKIWIPETMPQGIQVPTVAEVDEKIEDAIAENIGVISEITADVSTIAAAASDVEAWVMGTRDGTAVSSSDPAYHNNAKYYVDMAFAGTPDGYAALATDVEDMKQEFVKVSNQTIDNLFES